MSEQEQSKEEKSIPHQDKREMKEIESQVEVDKAENKVETQNEMDKTEKKLETQKEMKKTEKKVDESQEHPDANIDDLDEILDENEDPLNVTADERSQKDEDDDDPELKEEYEKFMRDMQGGEGAPQMEFLSQMMGQMFGADMSQQKQSDVPGDKMPNMGDFQDKFGDMFKNFEDNPQYDALANHLLQEFMDKDILEEPLVDSQKKYKEYLAANNKTLSSEDLTRYQNQQRCVDEILHIVRTQPNNKDKMIGKFEEMQEFGQPPEPLVNAFGGDSPFSAFTSQPGQGQGQNQAPPGMPNFANIMGGKAGAPGALGAEECTIF